MASTLSRKEHEFTLQLGIPLEYPIRQRDDWCYNSDGLTECNCIAGNTRNIIEECSLYGRPMPLAFYLPAYIDLYQQKQSPLYRIPKEIRDTIFQYALTDDGVPLPNCDNVFRRSLKGKISRIDSACALLQTCKAVYLEAYCLPMQINGYFIYRVSDYHSHSDGYRWNCPSRPDLARVSPWQYALIQRIDLSIHQGSIETSLNRTLQEWRPALRHSGAYVSPRYYSLLRGNNARIEPEVSSHSFALVPSRSKDAYANGIKYGDKVTLTKVVEKTKYCENYDISDVESRGNTIHGSGYRISHNDARFLDPDYYGLHNFTARAMVARPLMHLTLRMSRTDWETWDEDPNPIDSDQQLALDPACGGKKPAPSVDDMFSLAAARCGGSHPTYDELDSETWGAAIGALPDLTTFELILETFAPKKQQLDTVAECARMWKFPLKGTPYELVCDATIEALQWRKATAPH